MRYVYELEYGDGRIERVDVYERSHRDRPLPLTKAMLAYKITNITSGIVVKDRINYHRVPYSVYDPEAMPIIRAEKKEHLDNDLFNI